MNGFMDVSVEGSLPEFRPEGLLGAMQEAMRYQDASVRRNFIDGGRPVKWATLKGTEWKGGEASHLYQSGTLFESIYTLTGQEGNTVWGEVRAGEGIPYARIHQTGGTIQHPGSDELQVFQVGGQWIYTHGTRPHAINIPARPYMMFQDEDFQYIVGDVFGTRLLTFITAEGEKLGGYSIAT